MIAGSVGVSLALLVWADADRDTQIRQRFAAIDDAAAHPAILDAAPPPAGSTSTVAEPTATSDSRLNAGCRHPEGESTITSTCKYAVKQQLRSPSEAKFPGFFSDDVHIISNGCRSIVSSWVEAPNAFGQRIRSSYDCTYDATSGSYSVKIEN